MSCTGHPSGGVLERGLRRVLPGAIVAALLALGGCTNPVPPPCAQVTCDEGMICVVNALQEGVCVHKPDPCRDENPCDPTEQCVVGADGAPQCLEVSRCFRKECNNGKKCDPASGECTLEFEPCENVACGAGRVCNPATNQCESPYEKCKGVCCNTNFICDPNSGDCVQDLCAFAQYACACGPNEVCDPFTGGCLQRPGACGSCAPNQYCDQASGRCLSIPAGPPAAGMVGAACATSGDCNLAGNGGFCLEDGGLFGDMPDGMCSSNCRRNPCPEGAGCVDVGISICLDICLSDADCRPDYACQRITNSDPKRYCFPRGGGSSECEGPGCSPIGGRCTESDDCVEGATCSRNLPGGYCVDYGCEVDNMNPCSGGVCCLPLGDCDGTTIKLSSCQVSEQDCRSGYTCYPVVGNTGYCWVRSCEGDSDCRNVGDECSTDVCDPVFGACHAPCTSNSQCSLGNLCDTSSGRCYRPCSSRLDDICGPDGVCDEDAQWCKRKCRSDASCRSNQYCNSNIGLCIDKCTSHEACGNGSFCDALGRCRPACGGDNDCGNHEYCDEGACKTRCSGTSGCSFGEVCHNESGRCHRDLTAVHLGNPCARALDCAPYNATCLEGSEFPGGYCAATGCSAQSPCGPKGACVDDGGETFCLKKCTPGVEGTCRAGYTCSAWGEADVCVPAG